MKNKKSAAGLALLVLAGLALRRLGAGGAALNPAAQKSEASGHVPVTMDPGRQQMIGLTFGSVEKKELTKTVLASGRVAYDPQLYAALEEYRQAEKTAESLSKSQSPSSRELGESLVRSALLKLKLSGLSEDQIQGLSRQGSGGSDNLILPGKDGSVWIYGDIYEYETGLIKAGAEMAVESSAAPGRVWRSKVLSVDPVVNAETRTLRVRGLIADSQGLLRPGDYVRLKIAVGLGLKLAISKTAVIDTGKRRLVFVAGPNGTFEPTPVVLGAEADDSFEVVSGLSAGEKVATSADFLIDSESQIEAAAQSFFAPGQSMGNMNMGNMNAGSMPPMPGM